VLAGAGTGKTTTLASRLALLVSEGVPPERILLLTFTRRAAREMLARTQILLASSGAGQIVGGTFHSVAYRLIATHAAALGLPPRFGVLDASDAADLLDLLREEQGLAEGRRRFPRKDTNDAGCAGRASEQVSSDEGARRQTSTVRGSGRRSEALPVGEARRQGLQKLHTGAVRLRDSSV
jgi:DNA helicase II / ATP-dependent DNA helicase PcrA